MNIRQGSKQTDKEEIPEEWDIRKLGDKRVTRQMKAGGTPLRTRKEYYESGTIPFVRIEDITTSRKYLNKTELKITDSGLKNSSTWLVPEKSILYSMYASYGEAVINKIPVVTNQAIIAIIPSENVDLEYLYYSLNNIKTTLYKYLRETTQKNLNAEIVKNLKVPLPPLVEQQKIASILLTVDEAIQKTDKVIWKAEMLKRGLMQRLLTRGIGHTRFKKTEIGEIPEEWDVVRLEEVCSIRKNRRISIPDRVTVIPMEKIPEDGIYTAYLMRRKDDVKSGVYCRAGDILLAKITPSFENGKQGIVPEIPSDIAIATTEVFPIVCKNGVDSFFLFYNLKRPLIRNILASRMTGSTGRQRVPMKVVERFQIALPQLPEQQKIASILSDVDDKIAKEKQRKQQLEQLKKGLMRVLLTGKVRVKVE